MLMLVNRLLNRVLSDSYCHLWLILWLFSHIHYLQLYFIVRIGIMDIPLPTDKLALGIIDQDNLADNSIKWVIPSNTIWEIFTVHKASNWWHKILNA